MNDISSAVTEVGSNDDKTLIDGERPGEVDRIVIEDWSGTGQGSHVEFEHGDKVPLEQGRFLGRGALGDVYETVVQQRRIAHKKMVIKRKIGNSDRKEIEILKKLSAHNHMVQLVGTYTHRQFLGLLLYPVAVCDLHTFFDDVEAWTGLPIDLSDHQARLDALDPLQAQRLEALGYDFPAPGRRKRASPIYHRLGCLISAIAYVHQQKIRHKDLKPSNILLSKGRLWLSDFGSATDFSLLSQSATDNDRGTPRYFSPEVAAWQPNGRASDMFSLGCILLEILVLHETGTLQHIRENRSSDPCFHANLDRVKTWCAASNYPASMRRRLLLLEIRCLLSRDANARSSAMQLLTRTTGYDIAHLTAFSHSLFDECCKSEMQSRQQREAANHAFSEMSRSVEDQKRISQQLRIDHAKIQAEEGEKFKDAMEKLSADLTTDFNLIENDLQEKHMIEVEELNRDFERYILGLENTHREELQEWRERNAEMQNFIGRLEEETRDKTAELERRHLEEQSSCRKGTRKARIDFEHKLGEQEAVISGLQEELERLRLLLPRESYEPKVEQVQTRSVIPGSKGTEDVRSAKDQASGVKGDSHHSSLPAPTTISAFQSRLPLSRKPMKEDKHFDCPYPLVHQEWDAQGNMDSQSRKPSILEVHLGSPALIPSNATEHPEKMSGAKPQQLIQNVIEGECSEPSQFASMSSPERLARGPVRKEDTYKPINSIVLRLRVNEDDTQSQHSGSEFEPTRRNELKYRGLDLHRALPNSTTLQFGFFNRFEPDIPPEGCVIPSSKTLELSAWSKLTGVGLLYWSCRFPPSVLEYDPKGILGVIGIQYFDEVLEHNLGFCLRLGAQYYYFDVPGAKPMYMTKSQKIQEFLIGGRSKSSRYWKTKHDWYELVSRVHREAKAIQAKVEESEEYQQKYQRLSRGLPTT